MTSRGGGPAVAVAMGVRSSTSVATVVASAAVVVASDGVCKAGDNGCDFGRGRG